MRRTSRESSTNLAPTPPAMAATCTFGLDLVSVFSPGDGELEGVSVEDSDGGETMQHEIDH